MQNFNDDNLMPILIPDTSFNQVLSPETTNKLNTLDFLTRELQAFTLPGFTLPFGYRLLFCPQEKQYRLLTIADDPETVYAVRIEEVEEFTHPQSACVQVMVWRTRQPEHEHAVQGIARRFFCHFLTTHAVIITDSAQTNAAKVMWEGMIAWALKTADHCVYVWDGTRSEDRLTRIDDWEQFCHRWSAFCWGNAPASHLQRRVIISKVILDSPR